VSNERYERDAPWLGLPGSEAVIETRLAKELERAGSKGLASAEVSARLPQLVGAAVEPATGAEVLRALEASGVVVEWNGRWFARSQTDWLAGWISALADGGALLRVVAPDGAPARGVEALEIPSRSLRGARDGDFVLAKRVRTRVRSGAGRGGSGDRESRRRVGGGGLRAQASVVRLLGERRSSLVGRVVAADQFGAPRPSFEPFDTKFLGAVDVGDLSRIALGTYVVVDLEPSADTSLRGTVKEVLGTLDQPGVDLEVVRRHFAIEERFSEPATRRAAALPAAPTAADLASRVDLRRALVVTIDGDTARDFDDALSIEVQAGGGFALGVHIADVSHYVREGDALDRDAYLRGTSAYFPERAIPMLPENLSNGLCSLMPRVDRLALSALLDFDAAGNLVGRRFAETVICSRRRLTYREVSDALAAPPAQAEATHGDVLPMLRELERLMRLLLARRVGRGSIDFDLPEGNVQLSEEGATIDVLPSERTVAHRIVEECMIAANEAVAATLVEHDCAALHRVHSAPRPQRLEELRGALAALGLAVPDAEGSLDPASLQHILNEAAGRPEEAFVSALLLRSLERARYAPEALGHYALAARHYTHFTSPIRRYPDLLVHRRLKDLLAGRAVAEAARTALVERLPKLAEHTSRTERRAESAERMLLQWKKARFLAPRRGEIFSGRVSNVAPFGLFVQLDGLFVDGLVALRTMTDDYYEFLPVDRALAGANRGRRFRLGDAVRVVLEGIDERRRGLVFRLEGMEPARKDDR
jgi:ribonuclease R